MVRPVEEEEISMELRCPECCSPEIAFLDHGGRRRCGNCGTTFEQEEAFVTVADAEAHAEGAAYCICSKQRGCPQCFARADQLVGALIRDHLGRRWRVLDVNEKNDFPTVCGERHWDYVDQVTRLKPLPDRLSAAPRPADPNSEGAT